MHLVIDIGNTRVKTALFEQTQLKHFFVFGSISGFLDSGIIEKYPIDNCIFVSVVDGIEDKIEKLKTFFPVTEYIIDTPIPVTNKYISRATLGPDRLVSVVAGNFLFPSQNVLVIDFGTCIKYNFINNKNEFIGGAISPGIQMRFRALNSFTARLPLLKPDMSYNLLIGTTTDENILSGVLMGAVAEVNGFIAQYEEQFPDLNVVITGGDVAYFENKINKAYVVDTFLIMKGLNIVLNHNLTVSITK